MMLAISTAVGEVFVPPLFDDWAVRLQEAEDADPAWAERLRYAGSISHICDALHKKLLADKGLTIELKGTRFAIDRSHWGKTNDYALLEDGKLSALGFYLRAQGVPDKALRGNCLDDIVETETVPRWLVDLQFVSDGWGNEDGSGDTVEAPSKAAHEVDRTTDEDELLKLFAAQDVTLAFFDGPS